LALLFNVSKPVFGQVGNESVEVREVTCRSGDSLALSNAAINVIMLVQFV